MSSCAQCSVRESAICRSLSATELSNLSGSGRHQTLKRGQTVVWQGDESLLVGNVIDGVLKLCVTSAEGKDQTLGLMFPSDFIGRPFGGRTQHSVVALTDAHICTFRRSSFDDFARRHPELEHGLLQRTLTDLDRTREWMVLLGRKSATARVASFLLAMSERIGSADQSPDTGVRRFELPLSRQDIADLLGLTIETVSRQITNLRDQGIIETPGRRSIVVLDAESLKDSAEDA
jgi:CRP/FNR family transcriptional regulator, anaerobic regulatory protein